jgi:hypothetical protein
VFYPIGVRSSFLKGKDAGAWSWPVPSGVEVKNGELYLDSSVSLHGALLY